jgi:hypothetical protein
MIENKALYAALNNPVRHIVARVELYNGSTLQNTFTSADRLKSITIERVGEGKFFGFGICQKVNVKLLDINRALELTTAHTLKIYIGADGLYECPAPLMRITEVNRDEKTNELSITAYDALYNAAAHTTAEISLSNYTMADYAAAAAALIGAECRFAAVDAFAIEYPDGANIEGTENIREIFDDIAEATQTIYYLDASNTLVFRRLDKDGAAAIEINKELYITLESKTNRRLQAICSATELGDNVSASIDAIGSTQYLRDNAFLELRTDIDSLLNAAIAAVGGFSINQFDCKWRGNILTEIGDKIALTTKDNNTVYSYLLDDTITYDGTLTQRSKWSYAENDSDSESNATSLGDALRQTYARVDKANKEISIVASESTANKDNISSIKQNTDSIAATVSQIDTMTKDAINVLNDEIETLTNRVSATMTQEEIKLTVESELAKGASKVITNTGFVFDYDGLRVSKSNSEMETQITDAGMTVYKNGSAVLTANNIGVDAVNLHATTYLIIGTNSRFEDYGSDRTGCFWIGG